MSSSFIEVATQAYQDQKPGTSGLRKRVTVFEQPSYTENFIQAILEATSKPKFLVVGGDGRYYSDEVIRKIINVCAANKVERIILSKDGILSTPAASALIRSVKADGGIILTASHNPGGKDGDFGIKYNISNGGPAPESVTNRIYEITKTLSSYKSLLKAPKFNNESFQVGNLSVEVVDPIDNYLKLVRQLFDLDKIKELFVDKPGKKPFKMLADSMNGVIGPYSRRILVEELGASESSIMNSTPLPDFGGKHPDPNPQYASELVEKLKADSKIDFGVAFDGDGDRNMILGKNAFFVSPGDSLAVIAAQMSHIKYFKENGSKGFARSFPTSPALDRVAKHLGAKCYETPTGWKYFGNLMDHGLISLCGEESFGTGSDHIREKDGLWACLAWLSIIANTGKTVEELLKDHWEQFGRDYFTRYDYEECDATKCQAMMNYLEVLLNGKSLVGKKHGPEETYEVKETGNFEYIDPVDKSVSSKQGLFIKFTNGAKIVVRLSGTGTCGATVRLYLTVYSKEDIFQPHSELVTAELLKIAYTIFRWREFLGTETPTVIIGG